MNIFWSYAKFDNKKPHKIANLREAFSIILDQTTGSRNRVIVDEKDLRWGVEWKKEIKNLICDSDAMIPIITPSYFNRKMCIYELKIANENRIHVFPLYYRKCEKGLGSNFKEEGSDENVKLNAVSKIISETQYEDFCIFRNKDPHSEGVQDFLDGLASKLLKTIDPSIS